MASETPGQQRSRKDQNSEARLHVDSPFFDKLMNSRQECKAADVADHDPPPISARRPL
jgi:hypothetical protein